VIFLNGGLLPEIDHHLPDADENETELRIESPRLFFTLSSKN